MDLHHQYLPKHADEDDDDNASNKHRQEPGERQSGHCEIGLCRNLGKKVGLRRRGNVHDDDKALLDRDGTAALVG